MRQEVTSHTTVIPNQTALAAATGTKLSTLRKWMEDPVWPLPTKGPWPPWVVRVVHVWRDLRFAAAAEDDDVGGAPSEALERLRDEKAQIARIQRLQLEGTVMPTEEVRGIFARVAAAFRGAGEILQREYGQEAHRIIDDAMADAEAEFAQRMRGKNKAAAQRGSGKGAD